jgi:hypothetical protein
VYFQRTRLFSHLYFPPFYLFLKFAQHKAPRPLRWCFANKPVRFEPKKKKPTVSVAQQWRRQTTLQAFSERSSKNGKKSNYKVPHCRSGLLSLVFHSAISLATAEKHSSAVDR